jgi:hypothetical protein
LQTFVGWSVLLLALSTSAKAQTVDDIINKYIDAIGGKAVIASLQSVQIEGTLNAMGNDLSYKATVVNGKAFRSETSFNGSTIIQCVTDSSGWKLNPMLGQSSPEALPADQAKASRSSLYIAGPLVDYKSKGYSAELIGEDDFDGTKVFKIHLFDNGGTDVMYYIDTVAYSVLKTVTQAKMDGSDVATSEIFSNYQKTPIGYTMPYSTHTSSEFTLTYSKVTFNQNNDPQICAMPK